MKRVILAGMLLAAYLASGCQRPPQIMQSEKSVEAVDALWTAVTSKRPELLAQSAQDVERLHASGELGQEAYDDLTAIIGQGKSGDWEKACDGLKWFIKGQRRPAE